jgi:UDP-N-acetylglucosamine--N-acetylmuramyl-(pentapeptide) pyrophosphoryl-undecaprenol N-acetylglucosamine transferase
VTDNHQEKNARVLEGHGGAFVVLEKDCTARVLMEQLQSILSNSEKARNMSAALKSNVILDSAERICDIMEKLASGK